MKEISVGLSLMLTSLVIGVLLMLFRTYIILDLVKLFEIPKLSEFLFYQIFGLVIIINLSMKKFKSEKSKDDFAEQFFKGLGKAFKEALIVVAFWGVAYLMAYIIK